MRKIVRLIRVELISFEMNEQVFGGCDDPVFPATLLRYEYGHMPESHFAASEMYGRGDTQTAQQGNSRCLSSKHG